MKRRIARPRPGKPRDRIEMERLVRQLAAEGITPADPDFGHRLANLTDSTEEHE
jgi:hypothetical protein